MGDHINQEADDTAEKEASGDSSVIKPRPVSNTDRSTVNILIVLGGLLVGVSGLAWFVSFTSGTISGIVALVGALMVVVGLSVERRIAKILDDDDLISPIPVFDHRNFTADWATQHDAIEIKEQIAKLIDSLNLKDDDHPGESLPGFSIHAVIKCFSQTEKRRKYLFDCGDLHKERFSVYFDSNNIFTVLLNDSIGEQHAIRLAAESFPMEQLIILSCEVGTNGSSTTLRVFINGKRVAGSDLPFAVDLTDIDARHAIGADMNGTNNGKFNLAQVVLYKATLSKSSFETLLGNLKNENTEFQ